MDSSNNKGLFFGAAAVAVIASAAIFYKYVCSNDYNTKNQSETPIPQADQKPAAQQMTQIITTATTPSSSPKKNEELAPPIVKVQEAVDEAQNK